MARRFQPLLTTEEQVILPTLNIETTTVDVIAVRVNPLPRYGEDGDATWYAAVEPRKRARVGGWVILSARPKCQRTGVGMLSEIADMTRHWITFKIAGGPREYRLRIPTAWTRLEQEDAMTYLTHYFELQRTPHPPDTVQRQHPDFESEEYNPYAPEWKRAEANSGETREGSTGDETGLRRIDGPGRERSRQSDEKE
ncbi:hypothetical protein FOMPIDRAFT_1014189 [Fomitopsis schrenkii]|uniref:Uncharacterized protein n=1 Tax=Fomitopsis schrenkii TaxID=2126942 RepID=S8ELY1_FOMSC|nr:hypothetical protein FOMPIDRAFT_1014189 [Fomitopsis schrenkii]